MNPKNKKLVIFDFDGVLVDTLIMHYKISHKINKKMSLDSFKSIFDGNIYESLKKSSDIKQHPKFFEIYDKQSRNLEIPEIMKNLIFELNKNYNLIIVSSTPSSLILKILNQENIENYFSDIFGADIHTDKIVKIEMALKKYGIEPNNAIFITDTLGDIKEAEKCRVKSIAVTWGFHERETLEKGNPTVIIDDPRDLLETIQNVLK